MAKVWDFEMRLNLAAEQKDRELFDHWQDEETRCWPDEQSRLHAVLMGLRRRAKRYLQIQGPPRTYWWLHEYYFFLACYGIYAGKFQTYTDQEWLAIYVGASCAATRYTWGAERLYLTRTTARQGHNENWTTHVGP